MAEAWRKFRQVRKADLILTSAGGGYIWNVTYEDGGEECLGFCLSLGEASKRFEQFIREAFGPC